MLVVLGMVPYASKGLEVCLCSWGWRPALGDREEPFMKLSAVLEYVMLEGVPTTLMEPAAGFVSTAGEACELISRVLVIPQRFDGCQAHADGLSSAIRDACVVEGRALGLTDA